MRTTGSPFVWVLVRDGAVQQRQTSRVAISAWLSPSSRRHRMGVAEEFVDRPLVVRVLSVLDRGDPPVGSDQEIRRQPEWTSSGLAGGFPEDRKSTRLNSSHSQISYAVFC